MERYESTERSTHCLHKGDAACVSPTVGGRVAESAVWADEEPFSAVAAIGSHLAFHPGRPMPSRPDR